MKKLAILSASIFFAIVEISASECIPPVEYIKFSGLAAAQEASGSVNLGYYSRISPDGKYVLRSVSGSKLSAVTVLKVGFENGQKVITAQNTNLSNEAFPVQGSWKYLVDVNGDHYKTKDLVEKGESAKRVFKGGVTGFYAASAEFSESDNKVEIFSLSGPTTNSNEPIGLNGATITLERNADGQLVKTNDTGPKDLCKNLKTARMFTVPMVSVDGTEFSAAPAQVASGQVTTRIYRRTGVDKRKGLDCEQVDDLGFVTPKAIFGFPKKGIPAPLVYVGNATVNSDPKIRYIYSENVPDPADPNKTIVKVLNPPKEITYIEKVNVSGLIYYDREFKRAIPLHDPEKGIQVDSFPGITKDGRVMVAAHWTEYFKREKEFKEEKCEIAKPTECKEVKVKRIVDVPEQQAGYVVYDPFQSPEYRRISRNKTKCITKEEVSAVEAEFDYKYGFTTSAPIQSVMPDQPVKR